MFRSERTGSHRRRKPHRLLHLERLEDRTVPSTINWIGGSGDWNTASNWSVDTATMTQHVPGFADDVIIANAAQEPSLDSSVTVHNLTIQSGASLTLAGNALTVTGTFTNWGTFILQGTEQVNLAGGNDTAEGTWEYVGDGSGGTISLPNQSSSNDFFNLVIDDTHPHLAQDTFQVPNSLNLGGALTVSGGTFDASNGNVTCGDVTLTGGVLMAPNFGTFAVAGNWAQTGGTFKATSPPFSPGPGGPGTVTFTAPAGTQTLDTGGLSVFNNIVHSGTGTLQLVNNPLLVKGGLTNTAGTFDANGLAVTVKGPAQVEGGTYLASTATQIFGNLQINGSPSPGGNGPAFDASSGNVQTGELFLLDGVFNAGSGPVSSSYLAIYSGGTFNASSGSVSAAALYMPFSTSVFNGASGPVSVGDFQGSGQLYAPSTLLSVSGSWTNDGVGNNFHANGGIVAFTGVGQTISGNNTFNNLTKTVTAADTLVFAAGSTQTITGTLTLQGASGNPLALRSSSPGSQWYIDPGGSRNVAFVDVQDSNNNSATIYTALGHDSGDNTNWNFTQPSATQVVFGVQPGTTTAGATISPAVTVQVEDSLGNVVTGDNSSVTVAIGNNAGGGTLGGTVTVAAVRGVATFHDLSINTTGTGYTLTANDGTLAGATSSTFNITTSTATATDTWTGAVSSDWSNPGNWDTGSVPNTNDAVFIPDASPNQEPVLDANTLVQDLTIQVGASLTLAGNYLSATGAFVNQGTLILQGTEQVSLTQDATEGVWEYVGDGSGGTIPLPDHGPGNTFYNLVINDTHSAPDKFQVAGSLSVAGTLSVAAGTLDANGQTVSVLGATAVGGGSYLASGQQNLYGGLDISGGTFDASNGNVTTSDVALAGGVLTAPNSGTFAVADDWAQTGGTFNATSPPFFPGPGDGTVTFTAPAGAVQTLDTGGLSVFSNIVHSGAGTLQLVNNPLLIRAGLTNTAGTFDADGQAVTVKGGAQVEGGTYLASTAIQSFFALYIQNGASFVASSGDVELGYNLYIENGNFNAGSGTVTIPYLAIFSGGMFNASTGPVSAAALYMPFPTSVFNGSTGPVSVGNYQGDGYFDAPSTPLSVSGNWTNDGVAVDAAGTVTLTGVGQTISGNNIFNNLTKTVTAADKLTFAAGSTLTITGTLTLQGASGNLLALRSSSVGTQWNIDPQGSRNIAFVDVQDSDNVNTTAIASVFEQNSGGNTNWLFTPTTHLAADLTVAANPDTANLTLTAIDPTPADQAASLTYAVNWGDSNGTTVSGPGSGTPASHTYAQDGAYTVIVTATDQDGATSPIATALFIASNTAGDQISLSASSTTGQVVVQVQNLSADNGAYTPTDLVFVTGQGGSDTYTVNFGSTLTTPITIVGGGATSGDQLIANGDNSLTNVINKTSGQITWGNPVTETVYRSGVPNTTINANGTSQNYINDPGGNTVINGGPGANTITITTTSGSGVVINGGGITNTYVIDLGSLAGPVTINNSHPAASDSLVVNGAAGNNSITASGSQVTEGSQTINVAAPLASATINGGSGNNQITVSNLAVPVQTLNLNGGGGNNTVNLVNAGSDIGTLAITGGSGSGTNQVQVQGSLPTSATSQNVPLVSVGSNFTVHTGSILAGSGSFSDPDTSATYTATVDYGDGTGAQPLTLNPDHSFSLSHVYLQVGTWTVTVRVSDGQNGTGSGSFTATIATVNQPPVANAGGPYTVTYGSSLMLDGSASTDPDGDSLTYTWSINGHANAASGVSPTLTWSQLAALGVSPGQVDTVSVQVDDGYGFTDAVQTTLTVNKADQHISVETVAPSSAVYNSTFNVVATADSGLAVAIAASGGASGSGSGSATVTMTSGTTAGTVTFSQGGDANYNPATAVVETVSAQKANQTITVTTAAPASAAYNSTFSVVATADSGLAVAIAARGGAAGTGSGSASIHMTSGTTAGTFTFSQAGDANYNPATAVVETVSAQKANQTITVTTAAPASAIYNSTFNVVATADSGLAVGIAASGGASGSGSGSATVTMTSGTTAGTVTFSQAGNANYNPATAVVETVSAQKANQTITVTTAAPASAAYNSTFNVAATAGSGLAVGIAASGGASGSGSGSATVTMTSGTTAGTVTFSQGGDANYNPATAVVETVNPTTTTSTTTTTLVSSAANNTGLYGQAVTFTATVSASAPGLGTPTGSVDFFDTTTNTDLGTVSLSGGSARLTTAALGAGENDITATYKGAGNFLGSSTTAPLVQQASAGILLLDATGQGALTDTGNGSIIVKGGSIVVDSSNAAAVVVSGNGDLSAPLLDVTGGTSTTGNGKIVGQVLKGPAAADPLAALAGPNPNSLTVQSTSTLYLSGNQKVTLNPGVYVGGIQVSVNAQVTLNPGIYYMKGGGFSVSGNGSVTDLGKGVLIYNAPSSAGDTISLTGTGSVKLSALTSGPYLGLTFFQDRASTAPINITGNGNLNITGAIYAAHATLNITGNGGVNDQGNPLDTIGLALIVYDLKVSGNGSFSTTVAPL